MSDRTSGSGSSRWPRRAGAPTASSAVGRVRLMGTSRWRPPLGRRRAPRLIAVGAARPGAGKSVVASNLAVAIAGLGPNVILVDLDMGSPAQQRLFGITRPMAGIQAWVDGQIDTLDAALTATGIRKLHLIAGLQRPLARPLDARHKRDLARQLHLLDGDVVIVDVGASNRDDLFDYFSVSAMTVLVTGPDRPGLEATFGFIDAAARRAARRYGRGAREALARYRGRLVGNRASTPEEAELFHGFSRLLHEHTSMLLPVLGCLRGSDRIAHAADGKRPLVARRGLDHNVRAFHHMAEMLMLEGDSGAPDPSGCDLTGDAPTPLDGRALPGELGRYLRKHPRHPVDWAAKMILPERATSVRVVDVSLSGAALDAFPGLRAGDEAILCLHQLEGQPSVRIMIKHVVPGLERVGVAFVSAGDLPERLVAAAKATSASGPQAA